MKDAMPAKDSGVGYTSKYLKLTLDRKAAENLK